MDINSEEIVLTAEKMNAQIHTLIAPLCFSITYEEAQCPRIMEKYKALYGEKLEQAGIVQDIDPYPEKQTCLGRKPAVYIPVQSDAKAEPEIVYAAAIEELEDAVRKAAIALGADAVTDLHHAVLAHPNAFGETKIVMYGKAVRNEYPDGDIYA